MAIGRGRSLGLAAGALGLMTMGAIGLLAKLTAPLADRTILRPALGGLAFGLVGVALPLCQTPPHWDIDTPHQRFTQAR